MILVSGPMASGTRLLTRLMKPCGEEVQHDTEHGYHWWEPRPDRVVTIFRDPDVTLRSWYAAWPGADNQHPTISRALIRARYPRACHVSYEELVADPQGVLNGVADTFGLPRWECPEPVFDGNARWLT